MVRLAFISFLPFFFLFFSVGLSVALLDLRVLSTTFSNMRASTMHYAWFPILIFYGIDPKILRSPVGGDEQLPPVMSRVIEGDASGSSESLIIMHGE